MNPKETTTTAGMAATAASMTLENLNGSGGVAIHGFSIQTNQDFINSLHFGEEGHEENYYSQISIRSAPASKITFGEDIKKISLYKTELCRSYEETGHCKYGNKCQFAHGRDELRSVTRHPRYKTEICKTFHNLGTCPYGKRCRFIHMENIRLSRNENGSGSGSGNQSPSENGSDSEMVSLPPRGKLASKPTGLSVIIPSYRNDNSPLSSQEESYEENAEKLLKEEDFENSSPSSFHLVSLEPILAIPIPMDMECPPISPAIVQYATRPRSNSWSVNDPPAYQYPPLLPIHMIYAAAIAKKKRLPIFEQINSEEENEEEEEEEDIDFDTSMLLRA